jgi:hypothetical protein
MTVRRRPDRPELVSVSLRGKEAQFRSATMLIATFSRRLRLGSWLSRRVDFLGHVQPLRCEPQPRLLVVDVARPFRLQPTIFRLLAVVLGSFRRHLLALGASNRGYFVLESYARGAFVIVFENGHVFVRALDHEYASEKRAIIPQIDMTSECHAVLLVQYVSRHRQLFSDPRPRRPFSGPPFLV